ncbi:hypothetical protein ACLI1R_000650 [Corynebacterium sp. LaCa97]|uniref:hypothetical protein n=1 Tax=Corynebacterium sp. LaCa97 TaxID=3391431 RepID=UPI0039890842
MKGKQHEKATPYPYYSPRPSGVQQRHRTGHHTHDRDRGSRRYVRGATDGLDYDREIGDELQLASNPTNDVTLKVTDITLGEECRYGTYDYGDEPHDLDGNQYLQVTAEVDAKHVLTDAGGDWITLNDPDILDKDGFTQTTGPAMDCQNADDGHEMWSTTIHSGEKKRIYGAFEVPQGVEKVSIEDYTFDVKDL